MAQGTRKTVARVVAQKLTSMPTGIAQHPAIDRVRMVGHTTSLPAVHHVYAKSVRNPSRVSSFER